MHPWEDFAETWTHYLHMVDTLDTAASFGLAVDSGGHRRPDARDRDRLRPLPRARTSTGWSQAWLPLTVAVNSLNRSMGQPDLYPFALTAGDHREAALHPRLVHAAGADPVGRFARPRALCAKCRSARDARMPRVTFTANLRRHREAPAAEAEGATVREVLDRVLRRGPAAALLHPRRPGPAAPPRQRLRRRADGRRPPGAQRPGRAGATRSTCFRRYRGAERMTDGLHVATRKGLFTFRRGDGGWTGRPARLPRRAVTAVLDRPARRRDLRRAAARPLRLQAAPLRRRRRDLAGAARARLSAGARGGRRRRRRST